MPETYPQVTCTPASGYTFALGSTVALCTSIDDYGNPSDGGVRNSAPRDLRVS